MSIICQICNTEFKKIIPWQHLTKHDISSSDYKEKYGPLYSQETLIKLAARIPHNKGQRVIDPVQLAKHKEHIKKREERYQRGEFSRGHTKTPEQKQVLSNLTSEYARNNPDEMRIRSARAVETKIKKGYDFGSNMRGKTHSTVTKTKLKELAANRIQQKTIQSHNNILAKIAELNLKLSNNISNNYLQLICNICDTEFSFTKQYFTPSKFKTSMCPTCFPRDIIKSKGETEIFDFVRSICPTAISGYREKYHAKEIDIFIPELNLGVEFNGLYWHSESTLTANGRRKTADFEKQQLFKQKGIRIIQIFEDEWNLNPDIVKSRLTNILGGSTLKIYARKCQIKEVNSKDASEFCNQNHLMGKGRSNIRIGLYHDNVLVSLMTFANNNLSRKLTGVWEINRFASLLDTNVVGGASRLFKHFLNHYTPTNVISYSDNRWSTGGLYAQLGFEKISDGVPNYWYVEPNIVKRIHRFTLRKTKTDNQELTEYQNRTAQGFTRVWDCGSSKWEWPNQLTA